jgi:DNA-binding transcriptional regulator YdaS (Cro superfamily)
MLVEQSLYKAIQLCGSKQRKLAEAIGEKPDKIRYWLNSGKRIPFHNAIAIELATHGAVSRFDLAPYARLKNNRLHEKALPQPPPTLTISERVAIGIAFEKHHGKHQGARNDLKLRLNLDEAKGGRSDLLAANHAGFGSKDNYNYAKKVVLKGIFKLVQAMDEKQVSIFNAAIIAKRPPAEQAIILQKNKKQIIATAKQLRAASITKGLSTAREICIDIRLQQAEQQYQLPLRLLLLGLLSCCNHKNLFPWKPVQLKNYLAPFLDLDFNPALKALLSSGFVVKLTLQNKLYGQITSSNDLKQSTFFIKENDHEKETSKKDPPAYRRNQYSG